MILQVETEMMRKERVNVEDKGECAIHKSREARNERTTHRGECRQHTKHCCVLAQISLRSTNKEIPEQKRQ